MEAKGKRTALGRRASRMASWRRGGQALLTGYFVAANIGLVATNAWGLSPLAAILIVWLGGGIVSIGVAVAMASVSFSGFIAIVGSLWRTEFGAEYERS